MTTQTGIYVQDASYGWLPGNVISYSAEGDITTVSVQVPKGMHSQDGYDVEERKAKLKDYEDGSLPLQNLDEGGNSIVVPDMCDLPCLHEAAILYNLKARHEISIPYTRVGDIVIAMNPFKWINELYTIEMRDLYVSKLITNVDTSGDSKSGLDPHVYEVSSLAYKGLAVDNCHQSILVSGESGAGKTETVKIVMSHLATTQAGEKTSDSSVSEDPRSNKVVKRVLDSNPLLEAFGNAKTIRNDNSSRFGKYIQLQFDVEDSTTAAFAGRAIPSCILAGSNCETYLLEKSRVVGHEETERTYHIFYQILAAPEEKKIEIWEGLKGKGNESFRYVGETDTHVIEHKSDGERFQLTSDALELIGIEGQKLKDLMRAMCTIMQLGNLTFDVDPSNDDGSTISSAEELDQLSDVMGVDVEEIQKALTFRTIYAAKESYSVPLTVSMARDTCDAFAKEIYQQAFDWLVRHINEATCAEKNYSDAADVSQYGTIGLLDIFGFEQFKVNRFEQLCINYTNEKLQQKYNVDIFRSVQEEYDFEGIELTDVTFADNTNVVNLIEGRMGLLSVLNEECVRPNGNDSAFVNKLKTINKDIECLVQNPLHTPTEFAICHYADTVKYDATMFVKKNTDNLPLDLIECATKSSNELINTELKAANDAKKVASTGGRGRASSATVSAKFRTQLNILMENISKTRTRYIRCIKPNPEKVPLKTNLLHSVEQLKCAGVVAAVTISRVAYPNRLTHEAALERFFCLASDDFKLIEGDNKSTIEMLMAELLKGFKVVNKDGEPVSPFAVGKTRVYFKAGALEKLESQRLVTLGVLATSIQRFIRGFTAKSIFMRLKATAIAVQALARRNLARAELLRSCAAITSISCWVRRNFARRELIRLRREKASTILQTRFRIMKARSHLLKSRSSAIYIQKICRGSLQRPKYRLMLEEAREEARVNTKLAALQKRLADAEMKYIMAEKARSEAEKRAAGAPGEVTDTTVTSTSEQKFEEEKKEERETLLDESTEMIEYLKKQVFELKSRNFLLRTDLNDLKHAHNTLTEQHDSSSASYDALQQHATRLSQKNMRMTVQTSESKKELSQLKKDIKVVQFEHQVQIGKLTDLMKAKDEDNAATIKSLEKEIEALKARRSKERYDRIYVQSSPRSSTLRGYSTSKSMSSLGMKLSDNKKNQTNPWNDESSVKSFKSSLSEASKSSSRPPPKKTRAAFRHNGSRNRLNIPNSNLSVVPKVRTGQKKPLPSPWNKTTNVISRENSVSSLSEAKKKRLSHRNATSTVISRENSVSSLSEASKSKMKAISNQRSKKTSSSLASAASKKSSSLAKATQNAK